MAFPEYKTVTVEVAQDGVVKAPRAPERRTLGQRLSDWWSKKPAPKPEEDEPLVPAVEFREVRMPDGWEDRGPALPYDFYDQKLKQTMTRHMKCTRCGHPQRVAVDYEKGKDGPTANAKSFTYCPVCLTK